MTECLRIGQKKFIAYLSAAEHILKRDGIVYVEAAGKRVQNACYLAAVCQTKGCKISDIMFDLIDHENKKFTKIQYTVEGEPNNEYTQ